MRAENGSGGEPKELATEGELGNRAEVQQGKQSDLPPLKPSYHDYSTRLKGNNILKDLKIFFLRRSKRE